MPMTYLRTAGNVIALTSVTVIVLWLIKLYYNTIMNYVMTHVYDYVVDYNYDV